MGKVADSKVELSGAYVRLLFVLAGSRFGGFVLTIQRNSRRIVCQRCQSALVSNSTPMAMLSKIKLSKGPDDFY